MKRQGCTQAKHTQSSAAKRVARVSIIALSVFCVAAFIATAILFSVFFGRNELTADDISLRYEEIDGDKYPRAEVTINSQGNSLRGYIYGEQNHAGLILFAHGIFDGADSFLPEIMHFVDNGWRVMAFDGTGTRQSEGGSIRGLPQTKIDAEAAIEYIKSDDGLSKLPLMLYGFSMGGYAVAAVLEKYPDDISAVVCVAAFNSPLDTMYFQCKNIVGVLADIDFPFIWLYQTIMFGADADATAVDGINSSNTPVLVVYCENDATIVYDAIGIYAYREEITNPNVEFFPATTDYDGHTTGWLSANSAKYATERREAIEALHAEYGGNIPEGVYSAFLDSLDKSKMNELDPGFMNMVDNFFEGALAATDMTS